MPDSADLIVSVSGIRGIVGQSLTPQVALTFAEALAAHTGGGKVVLCRDGRPSGMMLRHAVLAGLEAGGCQVLDLGIQPTPTCGFAVRRLEARGGIQITASHNPAQWNGLKLFGPDGAVLSAELGQQITERFQARAFSRVSFDKLNPAVSVPDAGTWHRDHVLAQVDAERIRAARLKVFVDANGGAGGPLARSLLERLGCRLSELGCTADGVFLHEPEPIAANLSGVCPRVKAEGATIGFVLDPDADRLALIDESGRYIGEELTLALAVLFRLERERGPVVINMSTSRVSEDIAKRYGCACHRSAVGEANVVAKMREVGAAIGGEGNGGVIDPRVGWVRDPFIGMGLVLNLLAVSGKPLSQLVAEMPSYTIVKDKYEVDRSKLAALYTALKKKWSEAKSNELDGLRLDWLDRWVHVRPSNTEPIVRVIAEAPAAGDAQELCKEVGRALKA